MRPSLFRDPARMTTMAHDTLTNAHSNRLRWWLLAGCVCLIVYVTLFPFSGWHAPVNGWWLFTPTAYRDTSKGDVLANVLLYAAPGLLLGLGDRRRRVLPVALAGALVLSLGLETAQACLPGRVSSWLDAVLNIFGAGAGAVVASLLHWPRGMPRHPAVAHLQYDRVAWLGIAALLAWACAQLIPFVPSLDVGNLKHGLKPLWHALQGTRPVSLWRCGVYLAATAALMVTGAGALRTSRRAVVTAAFMLVLLPLRALMVERQLTPEAFCGTLAGVIVGMALARVGHRRASVVACILVLIYVVAGPLQPGPPGSTPHPFNWIPLHAQITQPINGLANLADSVWPWLALPCLCLRLGFRSPGRLLPLVALLLFGVEWMQRLVPGRYPDITTVLAGVAAWIAAVAYAGRRHEAPTPAVPDSPPP